MQIRSLVWIAFRTLHLGKYVHQCQPDHTTTHSMCALRCCVIASVHLRNMCAHFLCFCTHRSDLAWLGIDSSHDIDVATAPLLADMPCSAGCYSV